MGKGIDWEGGRKQKEGGFFPNKLGPGAGALVI